MTKYIEEIANEDGWSDWIRPSTNPIYKISCCDCGLVHDMMFERDTDGVIMYKVRRNNRATGQIRRYKKMIMIMSDD